MQTVNRFRAYQEAQRELTRRQDYLRQTMQNYDHAARRDELMHAARVLRAVPKPTPGSVQIMRDCVQLARRENYLHITERRPVCLNCFGDGWTPRGLSYEPCGHCSGTGRIKKGAQ